MESLYYGKELNFNFVVCNNKGQAVLCRVTPKPEIVTCGVEIGAIGPFRKLTKDPIQRYLCVQIASNSFQVFTDLHKKNIRPLKKQSVVLPSKVRDIACMKFFSYNRLSIVSRRGVVFIYQVHEKGTIKLLSETKLPLEREEVVTSFDFLATGELYVVGTSLDNKPQISRLLAFRYIPEQTGSPKMWQFDFRDAPHKYGPIDIHSSFYKVYVNFIYG